MKRRVYFVVACWCIMTGSFAQTVSQNLQKAFQLFEADPQLKYAMSSLYVIDAVTGQVVFDKNAQVGLAPASTQKVITAATAFDLLGKEYRYKTEFGLYRNNISSAVMTIKAFGDPTLGSLRYNSTRPENLLSVLAQKVKEKGRQYPGVFQVDNTSFETQTIPDGWIFQDIGNYYGAGASAFNWRENQLDIFIKSGSKIGDSAVVLSQNKETGYSFTSELQSAAKGTGDNAYIYLPVADTGYTVRGTIPVNESRFKVGAAAYNIPGYFSREAGGAYRTDKISDTADIDMVYTCYSPSLDSIIYWFLQKSINLYGEALVKTFAYEKSGFGTTAEGLKIIKDYWKQRGVDENELNITDGSGLSPQNRVTTHAQVAVLKYARKQPWFPYFHKAFPDYNNMKMKSGTIKDVKGFCGYHRARNGKEYIFAFLVNNYSGSASALTGKMYRVLNELK